MKLNKDKPEKQLNSIPKLYTIVYDCIQLYTKLYTSKYQIMCYMSWDLLILFGHIAIQWQAYDIFDLN